MWWLSHPPNTRKVASSSLAGNSFYSSHPRKADISCCHQHSTKEKKWTVREGGGTICVKHINHGKLWVFFTRRHRLHVSAQTNKEKASWQFDSIIMQNVSHHLRLFCAPIWASYDVIGEHLLINKSTILHTINHRQGIRGISGGRFFSSDI